MEDPRKQQFRLEMRRLQERYPDLYAQERSLIELEVLLSQTLDLEDLFGTYMQSLLLQIKKSSNAAFNLALFLPSSSGDFTLAAYANANIKGADKTLTEIAQHVDKMGHDKFLLPGQADWQSLIPGRPVYSCGAFAKDGSEKLGHVLLVGEENGGMHENVRHWIRHTAPVLGAALERLVRINKRLKKNMSPDPGINPPEPQ